MNGVCKATFVKKAAIKAAFFTIVIVVTIVQISNSLESPLREEISKRGRSAYHGSSFRLPR